MRLWDSLGLQARVLTEMADVRASSVIASGSGVSKCDLLGGSLWPKSFPMPVVASGDSSVWKVGGGQLGANTFPQTLVY